MSTLLVRNCRLQADEAAPLRAVLIGRDLTVDATIVGGQVVYSRL